MPITPLLQLPLTDMFAFMMTQQHFGVCRELEMKTVNCMEAYGLDNAAKKCSDIFNDYIECSLKTKQFQRVAEMQRERKRQKVYMNPPRGDSWIN